MKNKVVIIFLVLLGIILLDSIQALIFDRNTFIGIETRGSKREGILVDTYHCGNGIHDAVIKGFSYSCTFYDNFIIVDKSADMKDFVCAETLESFYEDEEYIYFWDCLKNDYIVVKYENGFVETVSEALKKERIKVSNLDKLGINYIKSLK